MYELPPDLLEVEDVCLWLSAEAKRCILSLSRAGPIAAAHPDVEHASILNRGEFSELTVRFVAGRKPAYRVEARGPAIEITIAR